jgi:hypothetical protein
MAHSQAEQLLERLGCDRVDWVVVRAPEHGRPGQLLHNLLLERQ